MIPTFWHALPPVLVRTSMAWLVASMGTSTVLAQTLPALLPPTDQVMQVLPQLPAVQMAAAAMPLAQARNQRLKIGPHEWSAKMAINRRNDRESGGRFTEPEIALETALRWPGKAAADQQLGSTEVTLGELGHADAWHEAARTLLNDWFDTLREVRNAALLQAQYELVAKQLSSTERRVQAGEAARLELHTARAEEARIQALAVRADAQARSRVQTWQRLYPSLPLPTEALPTPHTPLQVAEALPDKAASAWVEQILADNHELELAQAKAQQAQLQAQRTTLERQGDPTVGIRSARERGGQERVWGVYLSIPLGYAGRQADAQAALAQADIAAHELLRTQQRIHTEAWRVASEVAQTRSTRIELQRALEHIERSAALQARAYELGESPLADVLLARRNALEARLATDAAALDEMQAQARLLLDTHQLWAIPHETNHSMHQ